MESPRRLSFWRTALVYLSALVVAGKAAATGPAETNAALPIRRHDDHNKAPRRGYELLVRRRSLQQEEDEHEELPSFDGDVEAIFELAMAKALKQPSKPHRKTPAPSPVYGEEGGAAGPSDRPSLVPSIAPSPSNGFVGVGGSDGPSLTPSRAPSPSPFSASGGGSPARSDYPSLVPRGWPTSAPPVLSIPSGVPSDAPSLAPSVDRGIVPLGTQSPTTTSQPTLTELLNPHSCSGMNGTTDPMAGVTYLMTFKYTFSVETDQEANVLTVVREGEEALQETLGPRALSCLNSNASEASIVALDSLPRDSIATDRTCSPYLDSENKCTVVHGSMRFFLSESSAAQAATDFLGLEIADILNSPKFVQDVAAGLLRSRVLSVTEEAPPVTAVGEAQPVGDTAGTVSAKDEQSIAPTALIAAAGAAVVVFVGAVYFYKRSYKRRSVPSSATQFAGSSFNEAADPPSGSPFSEMVPDSYQFNGNMSVMSGQGAAGGMSAILEDEEVTIHSHTSSAIFMSETGFSEQAGETDTSLMSFDIPKSLYTRVPESPNLLGARKRNHEQVMSAESGEDTSVSDIESSSLLDETTPDSPGRHGALPNPGGTIASLLDVPELAPPRPSARPQQHTADPSADDSMHADELLLFC